MGTNILSLLLTMTCAGVLLCALVIFGAFCLCPELLAQFIFQASYLTRMYRFGEKCLRVLLALLEIGVDKPFPKAVCLDYIASLCSSGGRFDVAEPCHKEALLIYRQLLSESQSSKYVRPFSLAAEEYAWLLEMTERKSEAAIILTEAANVLREHQHPDKADTLMQRAGSLRR